MLNGEQAGGAALHMACDVRRWSRTEQNRVSGSGTAQPCVHWMAATTLLHQEHPRKGEDQHRKLGCCLLVTKASEGEGRDTGAWLRG